MKTTLTFQANEQPGGSREQLSLRASGNLSASIETFDWPQAGRMYRVAYRRFGSGTNVLLLPAMSTVSTCREWEAVANGLASQFTVTLVDWPGFGASSRLRGAYTPAFYEAFLREFVRKEFQEPVAVVAAGHAAGYVLRLATEKDLWSRAALVAPTWRGPLPTAMGERPNTYAALRHLVGLPGLGHALYWLNTAEWFLHRMYGRHVYADPVRLTPEFLKEKQRVARQRGARFAASAFVTGALDPFADQDSCFKALQSAPFPVLLVVGEMTPPKSRTQMATLAGARPHPPLVLPGSLGLHEECAEALTPHLREFLSSHMPL